ncbi:MAG: competence/damage-inducible protein A [Acidimicrobiales bacterium]|jgi:nicotinamide-nucleotide amidase
MNCEVIAVGTELLLGQIVDTNSSYIGEQLALAGIDSHFQTKVGDNAARMKDAIELALSRSDAVILCGGLGPTQDDITRNVIADVMGVELETRQELVDKISAMFSQRGRAMPQNNLLQAQIPVGGEPIPIQPGTAPGLCCPIGDRVIYAVPGVPWEMTQMIDGFVLPDLSARAGITSVIASRVLRTWGMSESGLAEALHNEIERLDETGEATIAFLASGIEGLKVRITAKATTQAEVDIKLADEEARVRVIIGDEVIFGTDDDTMESVVVGLCRDQGLKLGLAESLTGGLIGQRITSHPGVSDVFQGSIVSYADSVKNDVLGIAGVPAISEEGAAAMAEGAARVLGAECSVAVTGVAGPTEAGGYKVGTVFMATHVDGVTEVLMVEWPFDRKRTREFTTITVLNQLRKRLLARST